MVPFGKTALIGLRIGGGGAIEPSYVAAVARPRIWHSATIVVAASIRPCQDPSPFRITTRQENQWPYVFWMTDQKSDSSLRKGVCNFAVKIYKKDMTVF